MNTPLLDEPTLAWASSTDDPDEPIRWPWFLVACRFGRHWWTASEEVVGMIGPAHFRVVRTYCLLCDKRLESHWHEPITPDEVAVILDR